MKILCLRAGLFVRFWASRGTKLPNSDIPCCPRRRRTTVQNLTPLALSSLEKSVPVQTHTHTDKRTVNDISTPYLSACVDKIKVHIRGDAKQWRCDGWQQWRTDTKWWLHEGNAVHRKNEWNEDSRPAEYRQSTCVEHCVYHGSESYLRGHLLLPAASRWLPARQV